MSVNCGTCVGYLHALGVACVFLAMALWYDRYGK